MTNRGSDPPNSMSNVMGGSNTWRPPSTDWDRYASLDCATASVALNCQLITEKHRGTRTLAVDGREKRNIEQSGAGRESEAAFESRSGHTPPSIGAPPRSPIPQGGAGPVRSHVATWQCENGCRNPSTSSLPCRPPRAQIPGSLATRRRSCSSGCHGLDTASVPSSRGY